MKRWVICIVACLLVALFALPVAAMTSEDVLYTTYQYTYDGKAVASPHAYVPQNFISAAQMGVSTLKDPSDMKLDADGYIYISDSGHDRILILDPNFKLVREMTGFDNAGQQDSFSNPTGLFITDEGHLYVCDQNNKRILEFDKSSKLLRIIEQPDKELLPPDYAFSPSRIAVDKWGKMCVISEGTTYGIMEFSSEGVFQSFLGAQRVTLTFVQQIWRALFTKEQIARSFNPSPSNYNNLIVDEEGFFYTTSVHNNPTAVAATIQSHGTDGSYLPVKKFNFNGDDVLKRNGWYAPAGDVSFSLSSRKEEVTGPSVITSITLGDNGIYYLGDSKRNKIFGYDAEGNFLYAFAGTGISRGQFQLLKALDYHNGELYALDSLQGCITRFVVTEYGELLHDTLRLESERRHEETVSGWQEILKQNGNFHLAYKGLGNAKMREGAYQDAMEYFRLAEYRQGYSKAYSYYRNDLINAYLVWLILGVVVLVLVVQFAFRRIVRFNGRPTPKHRGLGDHLSYGFYVIFRPFDGFWDAKHENRGSIRASVIYLALAALSLIGKELTTGFLYTNSSDNTINPLVWLLVWFAAVTLIVVANWCVTSLTDGKGNMKDILQVLGYSVLPLVLFSLPTGLLSNVLTLNESGFISILMGVAYIWTGWLLFVGLTTIHDYSVTKSVLSIILTVVAMVIIVFIGFLLYNLFGKIYTFAENIVNEISLR